MDLRKKVIDRPSWKKKGGRKGGVFDRIKGGFVTKGEEIRQTGKKKG